MRAEVGLLTRNILIHGEMGDGCEPDELNDCEDVDFDNFGGHTRAIEGFKAYNIVGAEVTAMGQMTVLGSYPIHLHMCLDTARGTVIAQNSIHHCFRYSFAHQSLIVGLIMYELRTSKNVARIEI